MQVHESIMNSKASAAAALMEMCKGLKKMRDDRLFHSLGYDDFDVYCEEMAKIRSRQAYNYIATYERLGEEFVQSNASLGITKLELISRLPGDVAQEIVESGEAESMSTRDIKALVEENKRMTGQITLISDQLEEMTAKSAEMARKAEEAEKRNEELSRCNAELQEQIFNRPIEVFEKGVSEEERKKITAEIQQKSDERFREREREIKKKAEDDATEQIEKEKERMQKKYNQRVREAEEAEEERERLKEELAALRRASSSVSESGAVVKIYFQAIQESFNKAVELIDQMEPGEKKRYGKAFETVLARMTEALEDVTDEEFDAVEEDFEEEDDDN